MKKRDVAIVVIVAIGLIFAGFGGWQYRQSEVDYYKQMALDRKIELRELMGKFTHGQVELYNAQHELKATRAELEVTGSNLEEADAALETTRSEFEVTGSNLEEADAALETTRSELETALTEVARLDKKIRSGLQWWPSVEALQAWVSKNKLPVVLIADETGKINLVNPRSDPRYDCDDYADDLVEAAERDGYRLMEIPIENGRVAVWKTKVTDTLEPHIGTWTKIGNIFYYIKPVPPHHITEIGPAD